MSNMQAFTTFLLGLLLGLGLVLAPDRSCFAAEYAGEYHGGGEVACNSCADSGCGRCWEGWNLYWHDPYCSYDVYHDDACSWWDNYAAWQQVPRWYIGAEMLILFRDQEDEFTFDTPVAGLTLTTSDFRSECEFGGRVWGGYTLSECHRIEALYFGSHQWQDTVIGNNGGAVASISFESRLHNAELNLRRHVPIRWRRRKRGRWPVEASFLVGARYVSIEDSFTNVFAVDTDNQMIGPQIGLLGQFLANPGSWVDFEIKGAVLLNDVEQSTPGGMVAGNTVAAGVAEATRSAFVGDLSLNYNYQFSPSATFRVGYSAYWASGVALAAENFQQNINLGIPAIDHSGVVVYHGPSIGFVWAR